MFWLPNVWWQDLATLLCLPGFGTKSVNTFFFFIQTFLQFDYFLLPVSLLILGDNHCRVTFAWEMNQALVAILKMGKKHLKSPFTFQYLTHQNDVSKYGMASFHFSTIFLGTPNNVIPFSLSLEFSWITRHWRTIHFFLDISNT